MQLGLWSLASLLLMGQQKVPGLGFQNILQGAEFKRDTESESVSRSVVPDSLGSHALYPTSLLCPWISQARVLGWVAIAFSVDLPNPGIEPGLLHCRQILYHLSHQKRPCGPQSQGLRGQHSVC